MSRSGLRRSPRRARAAFKGEPDPHLLYQWAVQEPDNECLLFDRAYRCRRGKLPRVLREDFCGTGLVACHWARSGSQRIAYGLDLDAETLAWGRERNVRPLGEAGARIDLRRGDVRSVTRPRADVICALNFSYSVFHRPAELVRYLVAARRSLAPGGIIVLDAYGGWEAQQEKEEPREVSCPAGTFTYVWHQAAYNPIDNRTLCHIHFEIPGRGRLERAFTYDWRLYTLGELSDALEAAGYRDVQVYWDIEPDPDRPVVYRPRQRAENQPGWLAYVVAEA